MSLPICDICAKSGILCSACEKKLQENRITKLEVELSQVLYKLTRGGVGFEGAIELGDTLVIFANKADIGKIIGKKGAHIKDLSKKFKKQIRVVGTGDIREAIYDFIAPARIKAINRVYLPDGTEVQRIKIDAQDKEKLRMKPEEIKKIITALAGMGVELVFE
ncbi:MAG: KH domain-containing protein [Candidatus Altiarchaeota archaeon]